MKKEFYDYFANLFTTSRPIQDQVEAVLEERVSKVTEEMNEQLQQPLTIKEILEAQSKICPTKVLGPDGFPTAFCQKHCKLVNTCLHILNKQSKITCLNHTHITLILKVRKPRKVTKFRDKLI